MSNSSISNLLFVCTGNTCRSPMAEGIAKDLLTKYGIHDIVVKSCGTMQMYKTSPAKNAVLVCRDHDIDISEYLSKQINDNLVNEADLILTMEEGHKRFIQKVFANSHHKTYLLTEYNSGQEAFNVPDPIGASREFYNTVFTMIEEHIKRIIKNITEIR